MLRVNKVHRVSTVTTTVEILQGPAWTLIRGPRWRVEKKIHLACTVFKRAGPLHTILMERFNLTLIAMLHVSLFVDKNQKDFDDHLLFKLIVRHSTKVQV